MTSTLPPAADELERAAAAIDAGGKPDTPAAPAADPADVMRQGCAELVELAAALLLPFVRLQWGDELADAYGPKQRAAIADTGAALALKHGVTIDGMLGRYGPEIAFAAAVLSPALPTVLRKGRERRKASQAEPAPAPAPADAAQLDTASAPAEVPTQRTWGVSSEDGRVQ